MPLPAFRCNGTRFSRLFLHLHHLHCSICSRLLLCCLRASHPLHSSSYRTSLNHSSSRFSPLLSLRALFPPFLIFLQSFAAYWNFCMASPEVSVSVLSPAVLKAFANPCWCAGAGPCSFSLLPSYCIARAVTGSVRGALRLFMVSPAALSSRGRLACRFSAPRVLRSPDATSTFTFTLPDFDWIVSDWIINCPAAAAVR